MRASLVTFSILTVSAYFFISNVIVYAQASMTGEEIVQSYNNSRLKIPKSEIQYQELVGLENERFGEAKEALREIYQQDVATLDKEKRGCGTNLRCLKYFKEEGKDLVNDFVRNGRRLKDIYGQRRLQLENARKNFSRIEMRVDDTLVQPNRRPNPLRIHEQRVDDTLIKRNKDRYKN